MNLNEIVPGSTGVKNSKRIGRGPGSGKGKTCGRGQKGAGARKSPNKGRVAFEGGQMPLQRRLAKRGFKSHFVKDMQIVNLKALEASEINGVVDAVVLAEFGLVKSAKKPVKVLGLGSITKALELKVTAISSQAKAAIEAAGGKIELI
jgi:large subunit ribosomal protein L15